MHMRDSELVASIVAGDPSGLAAAYDRYAEPLYKYCRSMLSNPADAADAVQDTFVIASSRLAELRDPGRLRAWLYAVARNECLRILGSPRPAPRLTVPPGMADTVIDITEGAAERAELRALLTTAARGLNPAEREVLELRLRQGLEAAEVADVLGVSRSQAASLASRARGQLEACLAVLLVGRAGRDDCRELSALLAGWDGQLTPALRRRAHRHIERCATCTTRRVYELRPAVLLGLSAGAAMAAAAAESLRLAAGVPGDLKAHTMALAAGQDPGAVAHRAAAGNRAGPFGRHGFPEPLRNPGAKAGPLSSPRRQTALAAAAVLVVAAGAVAFSLSSGPAAHLALSGGKAAASAVQRRHVLRRAGAVDGGADGAPAIVRRGARRGHPEHQGPIGPGGRDDPGSPGGDHHTGGAGHAVGVPAGFRCLAAVGCPDQRRAVRHLALAQGERRAGQLVRQPQRAHPRLAAVVRDPRRGPDRLGADRVRRPERLRGDADDQPGRRQLPAGGELGVLAGF